MTFTWTRHTDYVFPVPSPRKTVVWVVICVLAGVLAVWIEMPALILGAAGVAMIPFLARIPLRTKIVSQTDAVSVHRQPLYANVLLWVAVSMALVSGASFASIILGDEDSGRLFTPAILGAGLVVFLLGLTYQTRRPLTVSGRGVVFNGTTYEFDSTTICLKYFDRGIPAIELTSARRPAKRPGRVGSRYYNLDVNTLLSTLEQLQTWHTQGRPTSTAEITAMLTAAIPDDLALGQSVRLTVPIAAGD